MASQGCKTEIFFFISSFWFCAVIFLIPTPLPRGCSLPAFALLQAHLPLPQLDLPLYLAQKSFLKLNNGVWLTCDMLFAADFTVLNKPQWESWQNFPVVGMGENGLK